MDLMADGDDSMKKIMLDMLIEELPVELKKMRAHQQSATWDDLGNVSHKMKSTLAYVGNDEMTNANKQVESICKFGGDLSQLDDLVTALEQKFHQVFLELQAEAERL